MRALVPAKMPYLTGAVCYGQGRCLTAYHASGMSRTATPMIMNAVAAIPTVWPAFVKKLEM
jgi:hypothetical protein